MQFEQLSIQDSLLIHPHFFEDSRGLLVKTFEIGEYLKHSLNLSFKEEYYSNSKKNVLRGMHVQMQPHATGKLVYCIQGEILDVAIDLRKNSPTYLTEQTQTLSDSNKLIIYIPPHVAHGFYTLSNQATIVCKATQSHAPHYEKAILWSSLKTKWPNTNPTLSIKDQEAILLEDFISQYELA